MRNHSSPGGWGGFNDKWIVVGLRTWCGLKQMGRKKEVDRDAKERLLGDETPEFEPVDR